MGNLLQAVLTPFKKLASKKGGLPIIIVLVCVLIGFYLLSTQKQLVPVEIEERVWAVNTIAASYADVQPKLTLYGQVMAARSSELRSQVSGRSIQVGPNFRDGGVVEQGEVLLEIDRFDYETALAEQRSILKEVQISVAKSQRKFDRAKELHAEGNVSDEFMDDAELNLRQEEARREQRQIAVRRADRDLRETLIAAPFNGVISDVAVQLGQQVSTSDRLADIIDLDRLEVRFSLSNAQFGRLLTAQETLEGRKVKISWEVGNQSVEFDGRISRAGAEITSTMGGVMIYASIDDTDRFTSIRPGALVSINVADKVYENVIRAQDSALYSDASVYVVREGRLVRESVEVLGFSEGQVFFRPVEGGTIKSGEPIVTTQLREAGAGARAEVR